MKDLSSTAGILSASAPYMTGTVPLAASMRMPGKSTAAEMRRIASFVELFSPTDPAKMREIMTNMQSFADLEKRIQALYGEQEALHLQAEALRKSISTSMPATYWLDMLYQRRVAADIQAYTPPKGFADLPVSAKGPLRQTVRSVVYAWFYLAGTRRWLSAGPNVHIFLKT